MSGVATSFAGSRRLPRWRRLPQSPEWSSPREPSSPPYAFHAWSRPVSYSRDHILQHYNTARARQAEIGKIFDGKLTMLADFRPLLKGSLIVALPCSNLFTNVFGAFGAGVRACQQSRRA